MNSTITINVRILIFNSFLLSSKDDIKIRDHIILDKKKIKIYIQNQNLSLKYVCNYCLFYYLIREKIKKNIFEIRIYFYHALGDTMPSFYYNKRTATTTRLMREREQC